MFYLPKFQWVCAGFLLSRPLCVCVCMVGRGELLELLFHFNMYSLLWFHKYVKYVPPHFCCFFFFCLCLYSSDCFLLVLPHSLNSLPSNSVSAVACLSPLFLFLSYLGFPTLYILVVGEDFASFPSSPPLWPSLVCYWSQIGFPSCPPLPHFGGLQGLLGLKVLGSCLGVALVLLEICPAGGSKWSW